MQRKTIEHCTNTEADIIEPELDMVELDEQHTIHHTEQVVLESRIQ